MRKREKKRAQARYAVYKPPCPCPCPCPCPSYPCRCLCLYYAVPCYQPGRLISALPCRGVELGNVTKISNRIKNALAPRYVSSPLAHTSCARFLRTRPENSPYFSKADIFHVLISNTQQTRMPMLQSEHLQQDLTCR